MQYRQVFTSEQVKSFHRDGFLVVRNMYDEAEVADIRSWTESLANSAEVVGGDWKYFEKNTSDSSRILSRIENFAPFHMQFEKLIQERRMKEAVSELFSEEAVLFKDKINFRMPGGDGFAAHQDVQAGWDKYASLHITAMIAIDETTKENGSLEVIPGLHSKGLLGEMWAPLSEENTNFHPFEAVHCQPGDAVFFDSYAPHRSGPNHTDMARRVLYITFNKASEGDQREDYYRDKHKNHPPDIERDPNQVYKYKV